MAFKAPERYRVMQGPLASTFEAGNNGAFMFKLKNTPVLWVIASDGGGWEHVSVSTTNRCPTWEEMCLIKNLFWSADDCVVQFHPPLANYVNTHPGCLHMWRRIGSEFELPPEWMVGGPAGLTPER